MESSTSNGLLITAQWTAAARARETERPDALFTDPWAAQLAGEGAAWLSRQPSDAGLTPVLRTRFLDDLMSQSLQQTTIRQVVLVAAGLDMRAYRMAWPEDARLFEIDQAEVLAYKEHVLAPLQLVPRCQRICVPADLTETWADRLVKAGFQTHHRALWIVEGLLMYLGVASAHQLMVTLSQAASPGSWLGLDVIEKDPPTARQLHTLLSSQPHPTIAGRFGVDQPQCWLQDLGWKASISTLEDLGRRFGRWPSPSSMSSRTGLPRMVFVAAQREASPTALSA
jgi:methyltransferase (TIGR00027 family)